MDVAIVSFRASDLLRRCLASLREHPPEEAMTVWVVDNASDDGTAEMVAREFPWVKLVENKENRGFAAATNQAIRAGDAPYLLVLNPDTRVRSGSLARLVGLLESNPEVGICGPRLELADGSFDHAAKRSFPTPLGALGHFSGVGRRSSASERLAQYRAPAVERGPVDAVNGAFMLIRRAALDEVGLFDEGFWMYMEDLDLCYRFAEAGWTTWFEPSVVVTHVKAGTTGPHRSFRLNHAFHYGMYRFYRKHYAPGRSPVVNVAVYAGIALKLVGSMVWSAAARALGAGVRPADVRSRGAASSPRP